MTRHWPIARILCGALAILIGLTAVAPPALAASPSPRPLTNAAAAKVAAIPDAALAQSPQATAPAATKPADGQSFLRSPKGAIAVALLAGALGYTVYSFSHDRVQSPKNAVK